MNKKYILLLTLFLTQTASVWAMEPNEFDYPPQGFVGQQAPHKFRFVQYIEPNQQHPYPQGKFQAHPQGEVVTCPLFNAQHLNYEVKLFANINLVPLQPLPQPLGQLKEKTRYTFNYKGFEYSGNVLCPKDLSLTGKWEFLREEKRPGMGQSPRDVYSLNLLTSNSQPVRHLPYLGYIEHKEVVTRNRSESGRCIFDGNTVSREKRTSTYWQSSRENSYPYLITNIDNTYQVQHHTNGKVVYVEVLPLANTPPLLQDYRGKYEHVCPLDAHEEKQNIEKKPLIYSDENGRIYLPHITQERWHHDGEYDVGFFIASYKEENRISFILQHFKDTEFLEGLYFLSSFKDGPFQRIENWTRLGNPHQVKIEVSSCVSSIPGISSRFVLFPSNIPSFSIKEYDPIQKILSIKGNMLTSQHINAALTDCNPRKINVFGLNKITLNENIRSIGTTFNFIAPQIEITNPLTINLSAGNTRPNFASLPIPSDGKDGYPGGNGGNFFMKASGFHNSLKNLTVNVSGGNGGNGTSGISRAGQGGKGGVAGICEVVGYCGRSPKFIRENGKPGPNGSGNCIAPENPNHPAPQIPLDTASLVNLYKDYYFQSAMNPDLAGCIMLFPNL